MRSAPSWRSSRPRPAPDLSEANLLRIGGVPLFTGFMYAAVGSYLARVWRLFDFRFRAHPPLAATLALSALIYANFFAHHFIADFRLLLPR